MNSSLILVLKWQKLTFPDLCPSLIITPRERRAHVVTDSHSHAAQESRSVCMQDTVQTGFSVALPGLPTRVS